MTIWAIIPVKPLTRSKTRLATALSPEERQALSETMFRRVLNAVKTTPQINGALVISRDTRALSIARELGAHTVQESGTPELNTALMRATQVVAGWRGGALLILPADLPTVTPEDIGMIIEHGRRDNSIVIATDRHHDGTNALFVRPPGLITYAYGEGSFIRHLELAREAGAQVEVVESPRLALDIDVPADLEDYQRLLAQETDITLDGASQP